MVYLLVYLYTYVSIPIYLFVNKTVFFSVFHSILLLDIGP